MEESVCGGYRKIFFINYLSFLLLTSGLRYADWRRAYPSMGSGALVFLGSLNQGSSKLGSGDCDSWRLEMNQNLI